MRMWNQTWISIMQFARALLRLQCKLFAFFIAGIKAVGIQSVPFVNRDRKQTTPFFS